MSRYDTCPGVLATGCGRPKRRESTVCQRCAPAYRRERALLERLYAAYWRQRQAYRTHCPSGHPYTAGNTLVQIYRTPRPCLAVRCLVCNRAACQTQRRARKLRLFRALVAEMGRAA